MNPHPDVEGLTVDLPRWGWQRRHFLRAAAAGLGGTLVPAAWAGGAAGPGGEASSACRRFPDETAGPFPGNGTNRNADGVANALALSGIVRRDLRPSLGSGRVAEGVPLQLELRLLDARGGCAPLSGHAVYLWHCDREGRYSMYSPGVERENHGRGVQVSDAQGRLGFLTVVPGCYPGRWPHLHFEVYRDAAAAASGKGRLKVSQIALPDAPCAQVYQQAAGYQDSVEALRRVLARGDGVFGDDMALQRAAMNGSVGAGYTARLDIAV